MYESQPLIPLRSYAGRTVRAFRTGINQLPFRADDLVKPAIRRSGPGVSRALGGRLRWRSPLIRLAMRSFPRKWTSPDDQFPPTPLIAIAWMLHRPDAMFAALNAVRQLVSWLEHRQDSPLIVVTRCIPTNDGRRTDVVRSDADTRPTSLEPILKKAASPPSRSAGRTGRRDRAGDPRRMPEGRPRSIRGLSGGEDGGVRSALGEPHGAAQDRRAVTAPGRSGHPSGLQCGLNDQRRTSS